MKKLILLALVIGLLYLHEQVPDSGSTKNEITDEPVDDALADDFPVAGRQYYMRSFNGMYLGGRRELNDRLQLAKRAQERERFTFEERRNGKWALKQVVSGYYVGGLKGYKEPPKLTNHCQQWEEFVIVRGEQGSGPQRYAIQNVDGYYLGGAQLFADQAFWENHMQEWELWEFVPVDKIPESETQDDEETEDAREESSDSQQDGDASTDTAQEQYYLKSFNGMYFGGRRELNDRMQLVEGAHEQERFTFEDRGNGKWALKQVVSGYYIGGKKGYREAPKLVVDCQEWEEFVIVRVEQGWGPQRYAIQNVDGYYLGGVELFTDQPFWETHMQEWEMWEFVKV